MIDYLKCLVVGAITIGVLLGVLVIALVLVVGVWWGVEWLLSIHGAEIRFPPGVSRGDILLPVVLVVWGLIAPPILGSLVISEWHLSQEVNTLALEKNRLENEVGVLTRRNDTLVDENACLRLDLESLQAPMPAKNT